MADNRPKVEPIRNPTLFPMEKLAEPGKLASTLTVERPFSLPGILLGTSAFTAAGWEGTFYQFYPAGMKSADYLKLYGTQFQTVEVDSTFYGTPSAATVEKQTTTWDKTVVDRTSDLNNWVDVFNSLASNSKVLKIFAFSNNHYAGHGPATAKLFWDLWNKKQ